MTWLSDHITLMLSLLAILGIVAGGGAWVSKAEEEHQDARDVGELSKQNAEIIKSVKGWVDKEEAVRRERQRIRECLEKNAGKPERCV